MEPPLPLLYCLPSHVSDPLDHPIIILKMAAFSTQHSPDDLKRLLMPTIDKLQVHLKELNNRSDRKERPILQYIVLLDLADVSIQSLVRTLYLNPSVYNTEIVGTGYQPIDMGSAGCDTSFSRNDSGR